jgi:metal-responsive CopG/Arc/MetJ family transcriptional regulator
MKVEFEDALWTKVKEYAETAGYSSAEEFVQHAVEMQIDTASPAEDDRSAAKKIKGLGYLDAGSDI